MRGVNDRTGIGLVEIYDLDSDVDSKLANISTRGLVQTGDNVLIAGIRSCSDPPRKSDHSRHRTLATIAGKW